MGKESEEWMLRNGWLQVEKWISYFDGKHSNPIRSFSAKELQKATDNCNENVRFGYGVDFNWYKGCLEGIVIFLNKYVDKHSSYNGHLIKYIDYLVNFFCCQPP